MEPTLFEKVYISSFQNWIFTEWEIVWINRDWECITYKIKFLQEKLDFEYALEKFNSWIYVWYYDKEKAYKEYSEKRKETLIDNIDYLQNKIWEYEDNIRSAKEELEKLTDELKMIYRYE